MGCCQSRESTYYIIIQGERFICISSDYNVAEAIFIEYVCTPDVELIKITANSSRGLVIKKSIIHTYSVI